MHSTVGSTLRQERVRQGHTHADVARDLGLPKWTVVDLEEGNLPVEAARTLAYLRVYARHLGLDAEALLRGLTDEDRPPGAAAGAPGAPPPAPEPLAPADADPPPRRPPRRRPVPTAAPPLGTGAAAYQPAEERWPRVLRRRPLAVLAGLAVLAAAVTASTVIALAGSQREPSVTLTAPPAPTDEPTVEAPSPDPLVTPEPSPPVTETASETPAAFEGRPPQETRVQVLHAGVDDAVVDDVIATLEALGYPVTEISAVRTPYARTTVFHVDGWETEARALGERDPRFGDVAPNPGFDADVGLHVGVGEDWPPPES